MNILLFGMLAMSFAMVIAKRITALINAFQVQSIFLFLFTLSVAIVSDDAEFYFIAGLLFLLKVILIPKFLSWIVKKIKVNEKIGLLVNPVLSSALALLLACAAYLFCAKVIILEGKVENISFAISLAITLIGLFIMVSRLNALAQIIGLLVMENGLFVAASVVSGGMPFFVEIAIFFDVFVCVIILGVFAYRINRLFTHIDVNKLTELKG